MAKRRLLQYSLRSILVGTVLLSLPCTWYAVQLQQFARERDIVLSLERFSPNVEWKSISPSWLQDDNLSFKGLVRAKSVVLGNGKSFADKDLRTVCELSYLETLDLDSSNISDDGLRCLFQLKALSDLNLSGTKITDRGLLHLKKLPELKYLHLASCTSVTDHGVKELSNISSLHWLTLVGTSVTTATLEILKQFPNLQGVDLCDLYETNIDENAINAFKAACPEITVLFR